MIRIQWQRLLVGFVQTFFRTTIVSKEMMNVAVTNYKKEKTTEFILIAQVSALTCAGAAISR